VDQALLVVFIVASVILAILLLRERIGRIGAVRDVQSAIQRAQDRSSKLASEIDWLRAASNVAADPLLVIDSQLAVQFINEAASDLFGELQNHPALSDLADNVQLDLLARDAIEVDDEDGLTRVIRLNDRPFRARAARYADGIAISLTDVAELQRLSRARHDFISNLSHELRNPLTSLRLLADTIESPAGKNPKAVRELSGKIAKEVDTIYQMSEEMLDLAAIESGQQVVRLVPTDLAEIVSTTAERLRDQAERRSIQIRTEQVPNTQVLADPEHAERAILNVFHNAIKFSPEGGIVNVYVSRGDDNGRTTLSVEDDGPGIVSGEEERIFERFFRSDGARGTPGTGLGLAIAHHILRAHGGRIWVENKKPPDSGAVFHLAFQEA
jgi:two-component system phosphate regulon sensor histidine kinase PhoR